MPMAGGDLTTLAMTVPGVRVNITGGSGNMNANGIPGASVLFTLNGPDEMDPYNNMNNSGASNNLLGANEVAEAAVVLNAYSPQYGRMAGAQVNLIGKSGTNAFHGNAFYNFNAQFLNANDFFNNSTGTPRGRSDSHQFGGLVRRAGSRRTSSSSSSITRACGTCCRRRAWSRFLRRSSRPTRWRTCRRRRCPLVSGHVCPGERRSRASTARFR